MKLIFIQLPIITNKTSTLENFVEFSKIIKYLVCYDNHAFILSLYISHLNYLSPYI